MPSVDLVVYGKTDASDRRVGPFTGKLIFRGKRGTGNVQTCPILSHVHPLPQHMVVIISFLNYAGFFI